MIKESIKTIASLIPPVLRKHPSYTKMCKKITKSYSLSPKEVDRLKLIELRRMIYLAYTNTTGYRQLYKEAGVQATDIQNLSDLSILPTVNKDLLRDNIKDFSVSGPSHRYNTTGGTTGQPFGFYLSRNIFANEAAFIHSYWQTSGWKYGDKSAVLRGSYVGSDNSFTSYKPYTRELYISANHLHSKYLPKILKEIQKHNIKYLQAYPSALSLLCDLIVDESITNLNFKALFLGSENIYSWQIEKFKKAFPKTKILSWYGHAEKASYATLIPDSDFQYEVHPMYCITEAGEANENGMNEIITTGLINNATPFIRYETNDYAEFTSERPKNCLYQNSTILKKIDGRKQEVIVSKTGKYISMASLSIHDGLFDDIKQFQFHQTQAGEIELKYIPRLEINSERQAQIKSKLEQRFNQDMTFQLSKVDQIAKTERGKMRYLIQDLDIKYNIKE